MPEVEHTPIQRPAPMLGDQLPVLFDELSRSRDRLAGVAPLLPSDVEIVSRAMHEVIWFFLTPPKGRRTELSLPETTKADLMRNAGDRAADLYTMAVACTALKLREMSRSAAPAATLDALQEQLDALAFDHQMPKRRVLALLTRVRKEIDARAAYVRSRPSTVRRFSTAPEFYRDRQTKSEKPDAFLRRVYGSDIRRGMTQADLRKADPAFYNVLHAWCSRHQKQLAKMMPPSRSRGA